MSSRLNKEYADDTTLTAESKEELKSLLMKLQTDLAEQGRNSWAPSSWLGDGVRYYILGTDVGREAKETKLREQPAQRMCTF